MGLLSSIGAIAGSVIGNNLDSFTGGWLSDSASKASTKRQYNYNSRLQEDNQEFQKYMAENAHQMEMSDLQKAGLNPALTVTGTSAGSIAGSSASQGTSPGANGTDLSGIINDINQIRQTNADVKLKTAQANQIKELLGGEKAIQNANIQQLNALTSSHISSAKFMDRKSSGNTDSFNIGGYGVNAGYSRTR